MEIHQLNYIVAVAKHQSFTRAADEICLSQSSLSQQIGKLEDELGVRLFDRTTRSVALTVAGREFVDFAKRILADIERSRQCMEKYVTLERGKIIIGALPISGYLGLINLIAEFQRAYPGIHLEIREAGSHDLLDWLQTAEIDVALLTVPASQIDGLDITPLLTDNLVVITPANHPLASRESINISELAEEEFISLDNHKGMYTVFMELCNNAGFKPKINYTTSQVDNMFTLAAQGFGLAVNSSRVAQKAKCRYPIATIPLEGNSKLITSLALPTLACTSPAIVAFREFTLNWIKENTPS